MNKRLKELRKNLDLTQTEFGDRIGISLAAIQNWEYGKTQPTPKFLKLISTIFNVNYDWLINGTGEMFNKLLLTIEQDNKLLSIPYYKYVTAANDGCICYDEENVDYLKVSNQIFNTYNSKNICFINATGNSMSPIIDDNDLLLLDLNLKEIIDEGIYVIKLENSLLIKRVQRIINGIRLISENSKYETFNVSYKTHNQNDVTIIGKVISIIKNLNRTN